MILRKPRAEVRGTDGPGPVLSRAGAVPGGASARRAARRVWTSWLVLSLGGVPAAAHAQADTTRVPLPPITVDALRAAVPLARLPIAATLLDSARTRDAGSGFALDAPLRGVPGVQLDDRHNQALGERLSIRGFGARASFGVRGVHVRVDGVPATMADGQTTLNHVDPAAISGAEIVRGPAAAFLGNAAGGALLLRTGAPPGIGAEALTGAHARRAVSAAAASSSASGGYHVRVSRQQADGWRDYSDSERWLLNGGAELGLGRDRLALALHAVHYDARNPGALTAEQLDADPSQANVNNVRQRTGESGTHVQAGAGWRSAHRAGDLELRAHAGARTLDNPIPPRLIEVDRRFAGAAAQLRQRASEALTWTAGVELALQSDRRHNWINEEGMRGARSLDQRERVLAMAAQASAAWLPARGPGVHAAVRYDRTAFRVRDALIGETDPDDSGRRILDAVSGAIGAGWTLHPLARVFVSAGTAFETPTTTELANRPDGAGGFNPLLQPERTRSVEGGVRGDGAWLRYELVVFRARVADKLVPFEVAETPGRQFYRNAASTLHRGVEAAVEGRVGDTGTLWAAYTRLDARFDEYSLEGIDLHGRRVPGAAGHQAELGLSSRPVHGWRGRGHVRRTGRVAVDDANSAFAPAYTVAGGRLDGRVELSRLLVEPYFGVENAFDRAHVAAVTVNAFGARYYEPGPGRSWYAGARVRWP